MKVLQVYSQKPFYGHRRNKDISLLRTVCFVPGERNEALTGIFSKFNPCITLFCAFLWRHCTTTTLKYLISRVMEDLNTRQRLSFSFPELRYSLLEFNSRNNCQHLTN